MSDTDRVVVGTLSGVEPRKEGWMRFSVQEEGKQYPVKCDTKNEDIKAQAMALLGQKVTVSIGESESTNINERTGKPYINRYLNQIAVAGPTDVSSGGTQPQAKTGTVSADASVGDWRVKELHIMREHAMERAIELCDLRGETDVEPKGLVEIAEVLVAYYVYGAARFGVPAFDAGLSGDSHGTGPAENTAHLDEQDNQQLPFDESRPPLSDDDIPF